MIRHGRLLILLNGEIRRPNAVRRAARECGAVLCADGGTRHAARLGLKPRLILGDMDSLPAHRPRWRDTVYLCDFDPDSSDFDKALRFAVEREFQEVWVAGGLGGRTDHMLVNLALAERCAGRLRVRFVDEPEARVLDPGTHRFRLRRGQRLSLLSISRRSRITTRGLMFPLKESWLERGSRGLSNLAAGTTAAVTVHRGRVWAIV